MGRWKNCFWILLLCSVAGSLAGVVDIGKLKIRANQGDAAAQEAIGRYYDGNRQYTDAYNWYLKASKAGRAEAQYRLGLIQLQGKPVRRTGESPVPANPERAIHWLKTAAKQDHAGAQARLGKCYAEGIGVRKDPVEGYKWSLCAAEKMVAYSVQANRMALQLSPNQIRRGKQDAADYLASLSIRQSGMITARIMGRHKLIEEPERPKPAVPENRTPNADSPSVPPPASPATDPTQPTADSTSFFKTFISMFLKIVTTMRAVAFVIISCGIVFSVICLVWILKATRTKPATPEFPSAEKSESSDTEASTRRPRDPLQPIDWFQFEKLMELVYLKEGYRVERRGGAHPDGGIDLVLIRGIERIAVQCKHWKTRQAGVKVVREFLGAMTAERFDSGIFVVTNDVTNAARELAAANNIRLLDQRALNGLMARHDAAYDPEFRAILDATEKRCPRCESKMVERVSEKGPDIGRRFWGCSMFPRCRYILPSGT